jgi:hypothetical protein
MLDCFLIAADSNIRYTLYNCATVRKRNRLLFIQLQNEVGLLILNLLSAILCSTYTPLYELTT